MRQQMIYSSAAVLKIHTLISLTIALVVGSEEIACQNLEIVVLSQGRISGEQRCCVHAACRAGGEDSLCFIHQRFEIVLRSDLRSPVELDDRPCLK